MWIAYIKILSQLKMKMTNKIEEKRGVKHWQEPTLDSPHSSPKNVFKKGPILFFLFIYFFFSKEP